MNDLRFFSQRPPWRELKFDEENKCYLISQFNRERWLVSVLDHEKKIVPHIKSKGELLPLVWDKKANGYIVPRKEKWQHDSFVEALNETINGYAGKLTLYDQDGRELSPYLYIFTETISEEDYKSILDRLGQLAVAHESGVLAPVTVLRETTGRYQNERQLSGDAFENLAKAFEENWENIKRSPVKEIKLDTKIIDLTNVHASRSIRAINQAVQKPQQRRQQILERQETHDSEENRFLAHVLKYILIPKAKPLADYLRNLAAKIKDVQRQPDESRHGSNYLRLWKGRRIEIEQDARRLERQAAKIEAIKDKAAGYLKEPFLKDITPAAAGMFRPSAKIADSKTYGPLYKAYQDYLNNTPALQQKSLVLALEEKSVRRTSNLYEMWVFFEVYARLVKDFGFTPDGPSPFDTVDVLDGEITLQEGSTYKLNFTPKKPLIKHLNYSVEISYSPKVNSPPCKAGKKCFDKNICPSLPCYKEIANGNWKFLTPDITLKIKAGASTKNFALDVKYRNYESLKNKFQDQREKYKIGTTFELDLLGTAKMKYHDGIGYDVAFVLHSDPNPIYTIFGAEPFKPAPHRQRNDKNEWWPRHEVGAVCITPSHSKELDKLLRCFLMYHMGVVDICWNCHSLLTKGHGMTEYESYVGNYFQCPDCGEFWISQRCGNKNGHHRLVKMGKSSFHKTSPQNDWNCTCPACGYQFEK
jgi:hypothetical protein